MAWKYTVYYINNSNPDHTHLKQQLEKNLEITFATPSENHVEKGKKQK